MQCIPLGKTLGVLMACLLVVVSECAIFQLDAAEPVSPANERFAHPQGPEMPDFRMHVMPLLGRLGCNGRACHGSFQGQGGFRLSLFGYDFDADHQALTAGDEPRVDLTHPEESLMLYKPTHGDEHGGGERMTQHDWEYHLISRWIEEGANYESTHGLHVARLDVMPEEIVFSHDQEQIPLRVVAHWSDGAVEDVTPLCRYQTNDESIATVNREGVVTNFSPGDTHIVVFYDSSVTVSQVLSPVSDRFGSNYPDVSARTPIDKAIVSKLRKLGIVPSEICTDGEFLRRVSLDLTGTLPTPQEIAAFASDPSPQKRARKIDELLERPTYVARWTTKLCEITGNSPRHFEDQAPPEEYARNWYEWIARRVEENVAYDDLVEGIVLGRSRQPGESYGDYVRQESAYYRHDSPADFSRRENMPYYWAKHSTRMPEERALNFSYAFLGVRIECAQCHKHPFDLWTQEDFRDFTAFFHRIGFGVPPDDKKLYQAMIDELGDQGNQAQRVRARLKRAQSGQTVPWLEVFLATSGTRVENGRVVKSEIVASPRVLGGDEINLNDSEDPREHLMKWMRNPRNPYFAQVFVNRVWSEYFGVGIVNPPDDMNQANPPSNAKLLDVLVDGFIDHEFDMKWLHRTITNSDTYQRSITSNSTNRRDERNFSRALARRLPAEILLDAIDQANADAETLKRSSVDVEHRAIGPVGGAMVGRRRTNDFASSVFGRSPRNVNCDCGASTEPNLLQAIYMQNDKDVLQALQRKSGWLHAVRLETDGRIQTGATQSLIDEAFLRTLSREPTAEELDRCRQHFAAMDHSWKALHELMWALLNTREFLTNH